MITQHRSLAAAAASLLWVFVSSSQGAGAAGIQPGDLLISEVMANPAAVSDANGEWFELFNRTLQPLDLNGAVLTDAGSDLHVIDAGGPLTVLPGNYFVLARNADPAVNGGLIPDYVYNGFSLANSADEIVLSLGGTEIARLVYDAAFAAAGNSMELIALPAVPANYALTPAQFSYGLGDIGTPGAPGSFLLTAVPVPAAGGRLLSRVLVLLRMAERGRRRNASVPLPARATLEAIVM